MILGPDNYKKLVANWLKSLFIKEETEEMNKFDNTYIDTSGYTKEQILPLAEKYSKASGVSLSLYDLSGNFTEYEWQFMVCHKNGADLMVNGVFVTDYIESIPKSATEITEKDLDDYLESQEKEMQELPEEFIIVNADKVAVREWLDGIGYKVGYIKELHPNKEDMTAIRVDIGGERINHGCLAYFKNASPHLPIVTPRLGVTGFDIETPNPNQTEIERMKKNIEELQASLAKLERKWMEVLNNIHVSGENYLIKYNGLNVAFDETEWIDGDLY